MKTLDQALEQVGGNSWYQYRLFITITFIFFGQAMLVIGPTYLYIIPQLICTKRNGISYPCVLNEENCGNQNIIVPIQPGYEYENIVTQLNLICDDEIYIQIAQSSIFFGSILGCLFFSYFGDHSGRRKTILVSWGLTTFGIIGIYFTQNTYWFIASTIIAGFGVDGSFNVCFVLLSEVCETKFRQRASLGLLIVFALIEILCALFFYAIKSWLNVYLYFILIPSLIGFILCFSIYETPKYHLCDNKMDLAYDVLDKMEKVNGRLPLDRDVILVTQLPPSTSATISKNDQIQSYSDLNSSESSEQKVKVKKFRYQHLFIYKSLRKSAFGFIMMIFSLQFIYYGGQYGLSQISNGERDIYIIGASIGLAELISYLITSFSVQILPRQKTVRFSTIFCTLCCGCFLIFGTQDSTSQSLQIVIDVQNVLTIHILEQLQLSFYPSLLE